MALKKPTLILQSGNNPTSYFWFSKIQAKYIDINKKINLNELNEAKTIILIRYIPFKLILQLIKIHRRNIKIILFIDDNLLSSNLFSNIPFRYKLKIFYKIYCFKYIFRFFLNEIWVTNSKLKNLVQNKLRKNKIKVKCIDLEVPKKRVIKKLFRIAYIGTSSHILELKWLKPLFEKIQEKRSDCIIEIFLNNRWRNYFRSVPRIKIIYPMDWDTFLLDSENRKIDIILNPLIMSEFNRFRSPTKFFDTTRMGAIGIYSNNLPYSSFIKNNIDGILLDNDLQLWLNKIDFLLNNERERKRIYKNALSRFS